MEILTVDEVASLLKISKYHVYELAKERTKSGDIRDNPLPCVRLGKSVRFRKTDIESWIEKLVRK
jgi:predicted DNA-binding transcriptional regulator AlpA